MKNLTTEQKTNILKTQATLTKVLNKIPCFFNIVLYRDQLQLVREHGKTKNNTTNWILTEKGKSILNFSI